MDSEIKFLNFAGFTKKKRFGHVIRAHPRHKFRAEEGEKDSIERGAEPDGAGGAEGEGEGGSSTDPTSHLAGRRCKAGKQVGQPLPMKHHPRPSAHC